MSNEGTVFAMPFDARTGRATGQPMPILERVGSGLAGAAKLAISRNGWAVYVESVARNHRLTLVDRQGKATPIATQPQTYADPRISPNGRDVALTILRPGGGLAGDIWVLNLARTTLSRLTFEGGDQFADWSSDGRRVVYTTLRGDNAVKWKPIGGGAAESLLTVAGRTVFQAMLSNDDKRIIYRLNGIPGNLSYVHRDSSGKYHALLDSRFDERAPAISPDDQWLAYVSDETGRDEVYVRSFPEGTGRWLISEAGGAEPRWRRDGRELFYRNGDTLFAVPIQTKSGFSAGDPATLFTGPYLDNPRHAAYDASPDGQRFIFISGETDDSGELMLVQNVMAAARLRQGASKQ